MRRHRTLWHQQWLRRSRRRGSIAANLEQRVDWLEPSMKLHETLDSWCDQATEASEHNGLAKAVSIQVACASVNCRAGRVSGVNKQATSNNSAAWRRCLAWAVLRRCASAQRWRGVAAHELVAGCLFWGGPFCFECTRRGEWLRGWPCSPELLRPANLRQSDKASTRVKRQKRWFVAI